MALGELEEKLCGEWEPPLLPERVRRGWETSRSPALKPSPSPREHKLLLPLPLPLPLPLQLLLLPAKKRGFRQRGAEAVVCEADVAPVAAVDGAAVSVGRLCGFGTLLFL